MRAYYEVGTGWMKAYVEIHELREKIKGHNCRNPHEKRRFCESGLKLSIKNADGTVTHLPYTWKEAAPIVELAEILNSEIGL